MTKELAREIVRLLQSNHSFVVATIFDQTGSAPRTSGAKMLVRPDGSIFGSIGGGRLEANAIALAKASLQTRQTSIDSFDLSGQDAAGMDMICGGSGEILVDFIDANDESNQAVYREAAETLARREKAWLITALRAKENRLQRQQCLVKRDGTYIGRLDVDREFLAKLTAGPAKISIHAEVLDDQRILVEPIRCVGTVFIFGAGHVSQRIAPLCETVGFRVVVLDDRSEYANHTRFREPLEVVVLDSFERLPDLGVDADSYLVIVTRGHLHDKTVLSQALRTSAGYIGMIGSRRKRDAVYGKLLEEGFLAQDLSRVYSPIGTEIAAETPEELAVSIVGELIKVRAQREGAAARP
ncbi:MAG TPA: XdhC family protein [Anaeromyxobacteraceae bacterium]|nr:XdhC family protein [Anaeromyxobacteraceae bacterium]